MDALRVANWQRSKDGQRNRNRPKPISPLAQRRGQRTGDTTGRGPGQVMDVLARYGPQPEKGGDG